MRVPFSVTIVSVWDDPNMLICSIALNKSGTTSIVTARRPYSVRKDFAGGGPNVSSLEIVGPAKISTYFRKIYFINYFIF